MRAKSPGFSIACLHAALLAASCSEGPTLDTDQAAQTSRAPYQTPTRLDDGWTTGAAAEVGLSVIPLERMSEEIRRGVFPNVHGVLIAKDGRLVFEEYFEGHDFRYRQGRRETVSLAFDRETLHDTRSVGKSLTSALVGIAVGDGAITSLDAPLVDFFPEHASMATADKQRITLRHALTMSAGLDWNEGEVPYTDPNNDEELMEASDDPAGNVLVREVVSDPGSTWYYNSGLPLLLGLIVSRTSAQPLGSYARERLFEPLGFGSHEWSGPRAWADVPELKWDGSEEWAGSANPAGSFWIRPRDLLKFGSLYLNEGSWNGNSALPAKWVHESLRSHVWRTDGTMEHGEGVSSRGGYGYFWWHDHYTLPYGELTVHSAAGNGGQRIWVIPTLDLVAVHFTGNYNLPWASFHAERLLLEHIVPWALGIEASYRHEVGRPARSIEPGELQVVELTSAERARYVGVYDEDGERLEVRDEHGALRLALPATGWVDLLPLGNHLFALGRRGQDGRSDKLFWPDERAVFVVDEEDEVVGYEYRDVNDGRVWGEGKRIR